jgi:hypothetical protein
MRPGMMPILHLPGEMMPGQLGPMRRVLLKSTNAFGDTHDECNPCVGGFQNGVSGVRRRDKKDGRIRASGFCGFGDGVEDGTLKMFCVAFAGSDSADDIGAIFDHLL